MPRQSSLPWLLRKPSTKDLNSGIGKSSSGKAQEVWVGTYSICSSLHVNVFALFLLVWGTLTDFHNLVRSYFFDTLVFYCYMKNHHELSGLKLPSFISSQFCMFLNISSQFYWEIMDIHHCISLRHRASWFYLHILWNDYHNRISWQLYSQIHTIKIKERRRKRKQEFPYNGN